MKTKEIQARVNRGYTMAIYGTRENIHEQMTNDIKELLKAINFAHSSTQLKDKKEKDFDKWVDTLEIELSEQGYLINGKLLKDGQTLRRYYNKEVLNL